MTIQPNMTLRPHHGDDPDHPPPYSSNSVSDVEEAAPVENDWQNSKISNLVFCCSPPYFHNSFLRRLVRNRGRHPHWRAELCVRAKNDTRLLRHGFDLSRENLVCGSPETSREDSKDLENWDLDHRWSFRRVYHFEDPARDPEWKASLFVFSKSQSVIRSFKLDWLTPETVLVIFPTRWDGGGIYSDDAVQEDVGSNPLFDATSNGGWWVLPEGRIGTRRNLVDGWRWRVKNLVWGPRTTLFTMMTGQGASSVGRIHHRVSARPQRNRPWADKSFGQLGDGVFVFQPGCLKRLNERDRGTANI